MGDTEEKTLDDVINCCTEIYELEVTEQNKTKYIAFLERQLAAHPDYDINLPGFKVNEKAYPYVRLMVNKLLLFSYLIGQTPIIAGRVGDTEEKRIESVGDLYMLRPGEFGEGNTDKIKRTDQRLNALYRSIAIHNHRYFEHGFPNWSIAIDEIGKDEEVVRHIGTEINTKMIRNCHSPYNNV